MEVPWLIILELDGGDPIQTPLGTGLFIDIIGVYRDSNCVSVI